MKTSAAILCVLLTLASTHRVSAEPGERTDINPALIYWQAFAVMPDRSGQDHLFTNEWRGRALDAEFSKQIATDTGNLKLYEMSTRIEQIMAREVGAKGIYPNVDFFSATTYHSIGLKLDLFTPMFAMSRIAGWSGHVIEQLDGNRLYRPAAKYVGPHNVRYVPVGER